MESESPLSNYYQFPSLTKTYKIGPPLDRILPFTHRMYLVCIYINSYLFNCWTHDVYIHQTSIRISELKELKLKIDIIEMIYYSLCLLFSFHYSHLCQGFRCQSLPVWGGLWLVASWHTGAPGWYSAVVPIHLHPAAA